MDEVKAVIESLERSVLELLTVDLMASLLVWQRQDTTEADMMRLLNVRVPQAVRKARMKKCGKCGSRVDGPCPVCDARDIERSRNPRPMTPQEDTKSGVSMGAPVPELVCEVCKGEDTHLPGASRVLEGVRKEVRIDFLRVTRKKSMYP